MFINRDFITSAIPCGADRSVAASARVRVTGNAKDAITATSAARNVLNIYRIITVLMTPPWLFPEWHKELIIRKNTRSGATAFNAPTNTSPNNAIPVADGHAIPRTAPRTRPATIRFTRLTLVHAS